jgi:anti-sigma B factor antagonist
MSLVIDQQPGGIAVIRWTERAVLDASNAAELRAQVGEFQRNCARLIFDMSEVEFIDSSIIGALVGFLRRARADGGDAKLFGLQPDVETIFEITRLQRVFSIHPSLAAAVQDFGPGEDLS